MKPNKKNRSVRLAKIAGALVIAASSLTACEGYDLADVTPSWLGSSIYDYLKDEGNYTNAARLIEDLGYKEVLAKTGSKTLFVADDEAFQRFYAKNDWGVKSYEELTDAQKKMLLFGAMINNACQVAYLSSTESGENMPVEGDCMRRNTSLTLEDTVPILTSKQMPDNAYWKYFKDRGTPIVCYQDMTTPPMVHFIEAFVKNKVMTNDDCDFLFNQQGVRKDGDANVNGINIVKQNVKCSNGFVHVMGDVISTLPNMASIINRRKNMTTFAKLMNRFCAPYYAGDEASKKYRDLYNASVDSVYEFRYFSKRSRGNQNLNYTPERPGVDPMPVPAQLKFDPGWNTYFTNENASNGAVALKEDMGVMLVPTDEKMDEYFKKSVLHLQYNSWDEVPDEVITKFLNVNMLSSLVNSVPSKFASVLNDANDEMGLDVTTIDSVFMACNGAVYQTNVVYGPVAYQSVPFPTLIRENLKIMNWAITQLDYEIFLNSQNSHYSLFVPTNDAFANYLDPVSMKKPMRQIFRFRYDPMAISEDKKVVASIWNIDPETGSLDSLREASVSEVKNRLKDILETHIVIHDRNKGGFEDDEAGHIFYKTKGGTYIKVKKGGDKGLVSVQGGGQLENENEVPITERYVQQNPGNGNTYQMEVDPIITSSKSVLDVLKEYPEFAEFTELLQGSDLIEAVSKVGDRSYACGSDNISLFNTFQYTVLVPENDSILALHERGELPTWDMVDAAKDGGDDEKADSLREEIEMFLKYHIIDNSFFIGGDNTTGDFESSAYSIDPVSHNLSYHKVYVNVDENSMTVRDSNRKTYNVKGPHNIMAREYQFNSADATQATEIYTTSSAVIHQIDGALQYKKAVDGAKKAAKKK